jgi:hypothetical protein
MIEFYTQLKTVNQLIEAKEQLNFELNVQRASSLWGNEAKSLLIHSMLYGYPIPALWTVDLIEGQVSVLDGRQRLEGTIFEFIDNKFELDRSIEDVEEEKIAGLKFSQLSEKLQNRILNYSMTVNFIKNMTDAEISDFFRRINNGLSLSFFQITRTLAGVKTMGFIKEINEMKFFKEIIPLPEKSRKAKATDEELIMQTISLVYNEDPVGLSGKEIRELAKKFNLTGIPEEIKTIMRETTQYLGEAIPDFNKDLRKVHVPILFKFAIQAQQLEILSQQFGGLVQLFFAPKTYKNSVYKNDYAHDKTASKGNVEGRMSEFQKFFDEHIETVGSYVKPVVGQRGRKPKDTQTAIDKTNEFVADVEHLTLKPLDQSNPSSDEKWEEFKQEFPDGEDAKKVV